MAFLGYKTMNIKSRVDKIEKIINAQKGITLDDLLNDLPWPDEQKKIFSRFLLHEGKLEIEQILACFEPDYGPEIAKLQRSAR